MTISFSGLASGLDTTSWVESLVKLKQAKVTTLQQQKESAVLSRDTLTSIRTFFNSFRSVLQKITDSKFNINTNLDLFAQNIATSAKMSVLTANATTEAEEASYKVKVDKLATKTQAVSEYKGTTTIVEKTTATSDTKLSRLGVTAGEITVLAPDGQQYQISIGTNDTIQNLVDKLAIYGVDASFNNSTGVFNIKLNSADIEDGTTGLKDALKLSDVEKGYITNSQLMTTKEQFDTTVPTLETIIEDLGVNSGQLTINTEAGEIHVDIDSTMTISGMISTLKSNGVCAAYDSDTGIFELTGAEIIDDGDTDLINAFGLDLATSSTVNADENNYLSDFGFTGENVQVTLHREGEAATTITVNSSDTIGDFITTLNSNGVNAKIENGVISIENGYIENSALEAALGLTKDIGGKVSLASDPVAETITTTATLESEVGDIIRALGTEQEVEDGYNLVFNGNTLNVTETTTLDDLKSQIQALGGTVTLDGSGNLSVTGGILTGSVANALGITSTNTTVQYAGTNNLIAFVTVDATPTTTLDYLSVRTEVTAGFVNPIIQLTQEEAEAAGYTWVTTQEELTAALVTANSSVKVMLGADIEVSGWTSIGDYTRDFKGELNGNGHVISGLDNPLFFGFTGTVKNLGIESADCYYAFFAQYASGTFNNCYVSNSKISQASSVAGCFVEKTDGDINISNCNIYNATITINRGGNTPISSFSVGGFIGDSHSDNISITNSNIYNSEITAKACANFIGQLYGNGNITIKNCSTSAILNGDKTSAVIGIDEGTGIRDISNITYDSKDYYDRDAYENQVITPGLGRELAVYDSNMCLVATIDMAGTSTIQDLFDELSTYGITGSLSNNKITLTSTNGNFAAGQVIDDLGLEFSTTNGTTTVGIDATTPLHLYYTETVVATGSTTLGQLGIVTGTPLDKYLAESGFVRMTETEATAQGFTCVTTAEELHTALNNGEDVILMNDIDLSGYDWEQISTYYGTLDGNGYSIKNLTMTDVRSGGMFKTLHFNSVIKNINITNASITSNTGNYIAVLADFLHGTAENISIDGNITTQGGICASGFVDYYSNMNSTDYINNIWVDVSIDNEGGITNGFINNIDILTSVNISNITTSGTLTGNRVYGFAKTLSPEGYDLTISNITSYAELEGNENYLLTEKENLQYITNATFDYRVNPHLDIVSGITQADISGCNNEIAILSNFGDYIGKIDVDENTTIDDLITSLSSYGITATLDSSGVLSLSSSSAPRIVSGFVADQLGISVSTSGTWDRSICAGLTSSSIITEFKTSLATTTSSLRNVYNKLNQSFIINGTITASGVEGTVIGISSAAELKMLADLVKSGKSMNGKVFILTSDIDLSGYSNWEAISGLSAAIDGQGHTISGLTQTLNSSNTKSGIFYDCGTIRNLKIADANIIIEDSCTTNNIGFLTGYSKGYTIDGITVESSTITGSSTNVQYVGGIVGKIQGGTIKNCKTESDVVLLANTQAGSSVGGIVGVLYGANSLTHIDSCENNIDITVDNNRIAGGIVGNIAYNSNGYNSTTISNCLNNGNITTQHSAGGIVGLVSTDSLGYYNVLTLENCVNTGNIGTSYASSFIGSLWCNSNPSSYTYNITMTDCFSTNHLNPIPPSNLTGAYSVTTDNVNIGRDVETIASSMSGKMLRTTDSSGLTVLRTNDWSLYTLDDSGYATEIDIDGSTTIQELDNMLSGWSFDSSTSMGSFSSAEMFVGGKFANNLSGTSLYDHERVKVTEDSVFKNVVSNVTVHDSFTVSFFDLNTRSNVTETYFIPCTSSSCTWHPSNTIETIGDFLDIFRSHGIEAYIDNGGKIHINSSDDKVFRVYKEVYNGTITVPTTTTSELFESSIADSLKFGNVSVTSTTTRATTYANTTSNSLKHTNFRQMGADSKLEELMTGSGHIHYDISLTVVSNGEEITGNAYDNSWTTMQDVIDWLGSNGITASVEEGRFVVQSSENAYIKSINAPASFLFTDNAQQVTSTIWASTSESDDLSRTKYQSIDYTTTKIENLMKLPDKTLLAGYDLTISTTDLNGVQNNYTITFTGTETIDEFRDTLEDYGINMDISWIEGFVNPELNMIPGAVNYMAYSTTLADFTLGGSVGELIFGGTSVYKKHSGTNTASSLGQQVEANRDSILSDLGVTDGSLDVYIDGVKNTIQIDSSKSLGVFLSENTTLFTTSVSPQGKLTIEALPDCDLAFITPTTGGSNFADIFGLNAYEKKVQFSQTAQKLTLNQDEVTLAIESITDVPAVADENTLLSDFDNGLVVSEGTLSVTVEGIKSNIRINEDETLGSFMEKLRSVGLEASLANGELLIHNNNEDFTINVDESTSNIVTLLGLNSSDTITGYGASSDTVTKSTSIVEERNYSVSSWANESTKIGLLGISDGTFSIYRNGQKETLTIDSSKTFGNLQTQLENCYDNDLELTFEDGYLKISSKTGAKVEVNSSTDTSNFAAITGISSDGEKSVISSRQLYCVNTESKLTESGLFRRGNIAEGTFTIGDAEFTIDENTTLAGIISQINNTEKAGVTAHWDTVDGKLVLTAKNNGASLINIEAGTSNFTDILGLTSSQWADSDGDSNPDIGESLASITKINVNTQTLGDNASFYINGTHFTSTSNTISSDVSKIKGLTLELKNISEGEEVIVTVKRDNDSLANAVQEVVDSYNSLITNIDKQMAQGSPLNNEFTLKLLRNQIRTMMTSTYATGGGFQNLASIGISTGEAVSGNISTEGLDTLTFDKDKFKEAYNSDSTAVKMLLVGEDGSSGLFNQIESILTQAESANGFFTSAQNSYNKQIQNITSKISRAETSVARYRSRLESKFASMDLLISQMQNNYSSFLSA